MFGSGGVGLPVIVLCCCFLHGRNLKYQDSYPKLVFTQEASIVSLSNEITLKQISFWYPGVPYPGYCTPKLLIFWVTYIAE